MRTQLLSVLTGAAVILWVHAAAAQVTCVPNPAGGYNCTGTVNNAPLAWPGATGPGAVVQNPAAPSAAGGGALYPMQPQPPAINVYDADSGRGRTSGNSVPHNLPSPTPIPGASGDARSGPSYGVIRPLPGGGFGTYDLSNGQIGGAVPLNNGGYLYYRP